MWLFSWVSMQYIKLSTYRKSKFPCVLPILVCSVLYSYSVCLTNYIFFLFTSQQQQNKTNKHFFRLNPVWTVHNGSLFMVSCSAEEFFSFSYGLVFCVKDFDLVGLKDRIVGRYVLYIIRLHSVGIFCLFWFLFSFDGIYSYSSFLFSFDLICFFFTSFFSTVMHYHQC